jgi:RimJ/RimL family protein N-acetyltransferase
MLATYPLPSAPAGLQVRQLGPVDRDAIADLFERLSPESRHRRFLAPKPSLSEAEIAYLTDIDHVSHEALAAVDCDGSIVGVVRYAAWNGRPHVAEVAAVVADDWQRRGIGGSLTRLLILRARSNGIARLTATTTWDNYPARALLARAGFRACGSSHSGHLELSLLLRS